MYPSAHTKPKPLKPSARVWVTFASALALNMMRHFLRSALIPKCKSAPLVPCRYSSDIPKKRYTPRRAVLYVPGNDEKKILKTTAMDVDCVVLDCEDGVAVNKKVCPQPYFAA